MGNNSIQPTFRAEMSGSCEIMSCDAPNTAIQACATDNTMCRGTRQQCSHKYRGDTPDKGTCTQQPTCSQTL